MDEQSAPGQETLDQRAVNARLVRSALREQELADRLGRQLAFTRAITDNLGEGVYALNLAGRITFVNPTAARLLGWTGEELLGKGERAVIADPPSDERDPVCIRKGGTTFPVARTAAPIVTDGAQTGMVVAFRDMTEVRALERAREELVALITHDMRSPLAVIQARAQLLSRSLRRDGLERAADSARAILTSTKQIDRMLTNLRDQTRLASGDIAVHPEPTDLAQLLARIVDQVANAEQGEQIHLDAAPLTLPLDPELIERVVLNLATNARKYSPANSPVAVRLTREGADAVVAVADRGIGIAEADLPHLFEKYYRTNNVSAITGIGLGLYSSRLIVEAHGGRLWAESVIGEGSTFRFSLPIGE